MNNVYLDTKTCFRPALTTIKHSAPEISAGQHYNVLKQALHVPCRDPLIELTAALAESEFPLLLPANLSSAPGRARAAGRPGSAGMAGGSAPAQRQPLADLNRMPGQAVPGIKQEAPEEKVHLQMEHST